MTNEVARQDSVCGFPSLAMSERELMTVLEGSLYPGAQPESIKMAIGYCKAAGLDIMQKPIHIVPVWDSKAGRMRDVIMPGVGLYRTQAARSENYAGVSEPEYGPDVTENIGGVMITYPVWCKVIVRRAMKNGNIAEFAATERWKENYATKGGKEKSIAPNAMWTKRPYGQISKCAEAQALRKAFPEVGSAPTADEMEDKSYGEGAIDGTVVPEEKRAELTQYDAHQFDVNFPKWQDTIKSGKKTAEQLISMIGTKGWLTEAQKEAIRDCEIADADEADPFVAAMEAEEAREAA
jgi:phage recombination protein Bet